MTYNSEDDSDYDYGDGGDFQTVGCPIIVPLGATYASGGTAAERVLLERMLAALRPLRKEGTPDVQVGGGSTQYFL